jgi:hypothetical protein
MDPLVFPAPQDRLRRGANRRTPTGRAARVRVGRHDSVARYRAVLEATARRANGIRATAAAYLTGLGADAEFIRRFASQFGKAATRIHRDRLHAEPALDGLAIISARGRHGARHPRLIEVNTYPVAILAHAARSYPRTATLIGA